MTNYSINYYTSTDYDKKLKLDMNYIKKEILTEQKTRDGRNRKLYMKFSMKANGITVTNMTKERYIEYWKGQYLNHLDMFEQIEKTIEEKFNKGLTSKETMIKLIQQSTDREKEKKENLKLLI